MKVEKHQQQPFKGISPYNMTSFLEGNVLLNKALFDITGSDVPWVIMANNNEERRERINRSIVSFCLIFVSPLAILPLVNRFAMKNIAKLTPKLFSKDWNAIRLSNEYLVNAEKTKEGLKKLAKEPAISLLKKLYYDITKKPMLGEKLDFSNLVSRVDGDYEKLRRKIINAKNTVLGVDILLVAGTFGNIGFFNGWQTRKKTGQIGYSAEMSMADKEIVEKRAEKYEKVRKIKFASFLTLLAATAIGVPLAVKHGLTSKNPSKLVNFIKEKAAKFDYTDAVFAKRLPLAISLFIAQVGIVTSSRDNSEVKDNLLRSSLCWSIFFGGDLLMASLLGRLSDGIFKTKVVNHDNKSILNKILPPIKSLKQLKDMGCAKSKIAALAIFWINFVFLSALSGFGTPYLINKIIKKDVAKDVEKANAQKNNSKAA